MSPVFICILKRAANYIATAWAKQQPCGICCLRISKHRVASDELIYPAIQKQPKRTAPWRDNDLPSAKQPSPMNSPLGRGVSLTSHPSRKILQKLTSRLLVWASGAQVLLLTRPKLNAGLAKHQGTSAKFWPQTPHLQPLSSPRTHQSTYEDLVYAWVMVPRNQDIRENWHTLQTTTTKKLGMKTGSGKVGFRHPLTLM